MRPPAAENAPTAAGMRAALEGTLTCPHCGHQARERIPTDACLFFYDCPGCGMRLKPKAGDCCVFCSYGDTPCPPVQLAGACRAPLAR